MAFYFNVAVLLFLGICLQEVTAGPGNCPPTCVCTRFRSECTLVYCHDEFDADTNLLVLKGKLCASHYEKLYQLRNVNKELHSSTCRTLPLCE